MDDEAFWVACQDNIDCQFYGDEYRSFFWKAFFTCFILDYCFPSCSVAVFGAICINVGVIRVFFLDIDGWKGECSFWWVLFVWGLPLVL